MRDTTAHERARRDPEGYWADWAKQLEWSRPWDRVLEWKLAKLRDQYESQET